MSLCAFDPGAHPEAALGTPVSFMAPAGRTSDSEEDEQGFDFPIRGAHLEERLQAVPPQARGCGRLDPSRFCLEGYQEMPAEDKFDARCSRCWKDNQEAGKASSATSSAASSSASS